jgi:hypothetical protein
MNQQDCTALPTIEDVCQDEIEVLAISVGRFITAGYVTGDVACWDAGHDRAETLLGFIDGPRLVASMAAVIRALRGGRDEPWHFMPANCCRLTLDELNLVKLLAVGRLGDRDAVVKGAIRLTGGRSVARLVTAVLSAGEVLCGLHDALPQSSASPKADQPIIH